MRKSFNVFLILILLSGYVLPASTILTANAEEEVSGKKESAEETEEKKEDSKVTGDNEDSKAEENKAVGMSDNDAAKIEKELLNTLIELGIVGDKVSIQFSAEDDKKENTKLFNKLVLTQLQLYELLYRQAIHAKIEEPVKEDTLEEGSSLDELKKYLIAFNRINKFIEEQKLALESTEGVDENLIEALGLLVHDVSIWQDDKITTENPLMLEDSIRPKVQENINKHTSHAVDTYFKYLNDGEDYENIKNLTKKDTEDSTKDLLSILLQWKELPHIKDAPDSIKVLDLTNVNQSWLDALQDVVSDMESDTDGETDKDKALADDNTSPELATSMLGRLGSSLFTVRRSANADNDPDKPITGTLGWAIEDGLKKTDDKYDPGPAAKDDFLAMFAATSVYTPFVSYVGDKDYVEAFKSLFNDSADPLKDDDEKVRFSGNSLGPLDILNSVQNLRKPLYYYNDLKALGPNTVYGHSTEDVKGVATTLTVGDLITAIKQKKELAAITLNGVIARDGDSWSFYNYSLNQDGLIETTAGEDGKTTNLEESENGVGAPVVTKVSADDKVNGGQTNTRVVFEMTFNYENPGVALLTGLLMHNIYEDTVLKSRFSERANEAVYLDALGNLVLNDGLVVLPASANPTYWAMPNFTSQETEDEVATSWTYNPYTVAFMDTYPAIYQGGTAPSSVNEKKDKNKYVLSAFSDWARHGVAVLPLKQGFSKSYSYTKTVEIFPDFKIEGSGELVTETIKELNGSIGVDGKDELVSQKWYVLDEPSPLQFKPITTPNGESIFPYIKTKVIDPLGQVAPNVEKDDYTAAILIAKNMYAYIIGEVEEGKQNVSAADGKSSGGSNQSSLREAFLFNNVTMPVLTGFSNPTEFDKSKVKSDLLAAGGDANVVEKWILNFSRWMTESASYAKNILAIASSDDVSLFKVLYGVLIDYGYYIMFLLLIFIIVIFVKTGEVFAALLKSFTIISLMFITLFVLPLIVPMITGMTSNYFTQTTALNTLMSKLEMTEDVNKVNTAGDSGLSVKLYNLSPSQAKELNEQYDDTNTNYLTNKFSINDKLGMYVQGTELRLDLYSFWRFDPLIISTEDGVNNPNTEVAGRPQVYHSDHSKSDLVSENESFQEEMSNNNDVLDYYTPFNLLENGFMKTINTYLQYYDPPQSVIKYPDGYYRSSYVVNTYMKSLAFLAAEPTIADLISKAQSDEEYEHRGLSEAEVSIVNQKFYPYGDILNLQEWVDSEIVDLPHTYANSLWTHAMDKAGFYNPTTGLQKRTELANRVNRKAYDIIMAMKDTKGLVSDATMIKLVALYATFEFNKEISYVGKNVYPRTVSLNEFSAEDILTATYLGQSRQFQFYDTSLVTNVYGEKGLLGLGAINLALITLGIYSILLSWILPILALGLLFYSIYLILTNKSIMPAILFTTKILLTTVAVNFVLAIVINLYPKYNNLYLLTLFIVIIVVVFTFLLYRIIIVRKPKVHWVNMHMRGFGGRRRGEPDINTEPTLGTLQESGGINEDAIQSRRTRSSDPYGLY